MEEEIEEKEPWYKGPIKWILSLFLILLMLLWLIPMYGIKLDPNPGYVPQINEVFTYSSFVNKSSDDYVQLLEPDNPIIKQTSNKIISLSGCKKSKVCNAKTIFYFVRDNIDYVNDPVRKEYFNDAVSTLQVSVGDCDDFSILLSNLLGAIGINTRFVFISGHVYVQAYLPDALKKYKTDDWVNLDATCSNCEFGEITYSVSQAEKRYLG